jgi:hypothetical protein
MSRSSSTSSLCRSLCQGAPAHTTCAGGRSRGRTATGAAAASRGGLRSCAVSAARCSAGAPSAFRAPGRRPTSQPKHSPGEESFCSVRANFVLWVKTAPSYGRRRRRRPRGRGATATAPAPSTPLSRPGFAMDPAFAGFRINTLVQACINNLAPSNRGKHAADMDSHAKGL